MIVSCFQKVRIGMLKSILASSLVLSFCVERSAFAAGADSGLTQLGHGKLGRAEYTIRGAEAMPPTGFWRVEVEFSNPGSEGILEVELEEGGMRFFRGREGTARSVVHMMCPSQKGRQILFLPISTLSGRSEYEQAFLRVRGFGDQNEHMVSGRSRGTYGLAISAIWKPSEVGELQKKLEEQKRSDASRNEILPRFENVQGFSCSQGDLIRSDFPNTYPGFGSFSSLFGLWMSRHEWNSAPAPVRAVARDWIRAGGRLFLEPESTNAAESEPLVGLPPVGLVDASVPLGLGTIFSKSRTTSPDIANLKVVATKIANSPYPGLETDYHQWSSSLIEAPKVNAPLMIVFVLGFAILVVPLNLLWFAPKGKRSRLVLTVPAISLGATVLLVGLILVQDGFGGKGIRNGLLLLTPGESRAMWYQEQLSRTALLSSRAFAVPADISLVSVLPERHSTKKQLRLHRVDGQASGNWFESRALQGHMLQGPLPSRAEVVLRSAPGETPVLVSSVSHRLTPVYFVSAGKYWRADALEPGKPTTLSATKRDVFEQWLKESVTEPSANLKARIREAASRRDANWFYAGAQDTPEFWIPTEPQIRWVRNQMLCVGPVEKEVLQ
jgi:hypothetical protein